MTDTLLSGPAVVASDYDGTFADEHGQVPARLARAVQAARADGIDVVIVTARPPRWLTHLTDIAGGTILAANGAFEFTPDTGKVSVLRAFSPSESRGIADALAGIPGVSLSAETARGFWRDSSYPSNPPAGAVEDPHDPTMTVAPIRDITVEAGKILAVSNVLPPEDFLRLVGAALAGRAELHLSTNSGLAELSPPGVSKASALERWSLARGYTAADVWAVGDMPNDLPMLRWARTGFAVRNAHPDVLAEAHAVAPAHTEAGVASVLEAARRARAMSARVARVEA